MFAGVFALSFWQWLIITLIVTHITCVAVTVFLHRHQAHRSLELHPIASHFFRFWLWLTTGMVTKEWTAVHRKHHSAAETEDDPHSPIVYGIWKVLFQGVGLYQKEANNADTLKTFGRGTPDDWIEHNIYTPYHWAGVLSLLVIDIVLFGFIPGAIMYGIQVLWIPFWAAGVVNGVGHYWGYRNFATKDESRNIVPWGIVIAGEELHNNHHAHAHSARLSNKWYEFDIGWMWIKLMELVSLAQVNKVSPKVKFDFSKSVCDLETLKAVVTHRLQVVAEYNRAVRRVFAAEIKRLKSAGGQSISEIGALKRLRRAMLREGVDLQDEEKKVLGDVSASNKVVATLYQMKRSLLSLWEGASGTPEQLVHQLQDWCHRAEESGIRALQEFSFRLKAYAVAEH